MFYYLYRLDGETRKTMVMTTAMATLQAYVERILEREDGQDMIEYALLAALISIVAIAIIVLVGPYLKDAFQDVVNGLASA